MEERVFAELRRLVREDPVPEVRREAARALGIAGPQAVDPLIGALDDSSDAVRRAAALALGRVGGAEAVTALMDVLARHHELWQEASAALAAAGAPDVVERLMPLLQDEATAVRSGAIRAVAAATKAERLPHEDALVGYVDEDGHRYPLF